MSADKKDFYGKEVADAIKKACEELHVPQEELNIEVIETGSTGIFGLIRKKARIRVSIKEQVEVPQERPRRPTAAAIAKPAEKVVPVEPVAEEIPTPAVEIVDVANEKIGDDKGDEVAEETEETSQESLDIVQAELSQLVELMGFPSTVTVQATGLSVDCSIKGEFEEDLIGPEGKTLDSIQYLIRKMAARKCPERLRISVDVGDFREKRLDELKVKAGELANLVKENGKTQVIPGLNPYERREIHMILQEDKEVRSRSVGDGLFKKILIYKPGKGNRGGRKKPGTRGRRGSTAKNTKPTSDKE